MSAQILTIALQVAVGCIWLFTLAYASSANDMSAKQSVARDGVVETHPIPADPQVVHP
jgi:hypothetical protein